MDNRWLIVAGFAVFGLTSVWMGGLTLEIGPYSLLWPIIISGAGSGMVFVPLSTISMGTLPTSRSATPAGLFNLMRNVGGGIGISVVNTLVARHAQVHRDELSRYISPSATYERAYHLYYGTMLPHSGPRLAMLRHTG